MRDELKKRLLNIMLRGLSMASRFILIIALAKLLEPSELGEYGLLVVSITFCVLILGAEFHSYTMREINQEPPERWSFVIQHQIIAQLMLIVILFPLILSIFLTDLLSVQYIYWFSALLFIELLGQEIHWLLISIQKQILSSVVMFTRVGAWVYIILPIMYFNSDMNNIQSVLLAWLLGGVIAVTIGIIFLWKSIPIWKVYSLDKKWIKNGFKIGGYFLLAAASLKGLFTFDRFTVELLGTPEQLGVYVFYIGVVMGTINFLEPAVFSFLYPKMIQNYHKKNKKEYMKLYNELSISTCLISVLLGSLVWFLMPYLVGWIGRPIYSEYYNILMILILMGVIYAVGMIPHYGLYAMKHDAWIIGAQLSSVVVYVVVINIYSHETAIMTVSVAMLSAFLWAGLIKLFGYTNSKQNSFLIVR